jgi:hypothetical protein
MTALVQSENAIGGTTLPAVTPGAVVDEWLNIDVSSIIGVAIAGAVLLFFGGRILRPAMVLAASMLGAVLGLQLASATREGSLPAQIQALGVPHRAWVIGLPVGFGLATLAIARFAMAVLLGASVGTALLLIGLAIITPGRPIEDVSSDGMGVSSVAFVQDPVAEADDPTARMVAEAVTHALESGGAAEASGWIPDLSEVSAVVPEDLSDWWRDVTADTPADRVDLVVVVATVTGLCSGLLALILPTRTAVVVTSVCGGWLVSASLVTAWVRWMPETSPPTPFNTLLGWGVLTGVGVIFQWNSVRRGDKD